MFGSSILEVAIGVIFVFILVSIICTAIREGIEGWLKTRAAYLEHGIRELLQDKDGTGIAKSLFNHPLIFGLYNEAYVPGKAEMKPSILAKGGNLPSYIPSKNFALALMDIAARGPETDVVSSDPNSPIISLHSIKFNIANIRNPAVQRVMLSAIDGAQGDLNKMQASLEAWYDSSMDRVSGWYKRSTQWVLFFIGILVAVGLNINTITIIDYFSHNEAARSIVVQKATAAAKDPSTTTDKNYADTKKDLDDLGLPIGWTNDWGAPRKGDGPWFNVFGPVLGWLFTALAATLGAPFWFDMLNKVMVVRSTVKPNQKSPNEASEDRQLPQQPQLQQPPIVNNIVQPLTNDIVPNNVQIPPGQSPAPADKDTDIDGCDVAVTDVTTDEALPVSEGGVA